jgi:tetratricopeptide (TPR) repeat protein
MKFVLSFLFSLMSLAQINAQTVDALLADALATERLPNEALALAKYKKIYGSHTNNITAVVKISELNSRIGSRENNIEKRDAYYKEAEKFADYALRLNPKSDIANVAKAMVLGKISLGKPAKEKIRLAKEVKKYADIALNINSNNYVAWHIIGRWNFELANISALERAAAKVFVASIPVGSVDKAIQYFEKARSIAPTFTLNSLELAKAYYKAGNKTKAIALLRELQGFAVTTDDDNYTKKLARDLIKEWQ